MRIVLKLIMNLHKSDQVKFVIILDQIHNILLKSAPSLGNAEDTVISLPLQKEIKLKDEDVLFISQTEFEMNNITILFRLFIIKGKETPSLKHRLKPSLKSAKYEWMPINTIKTISTMNTQIKKALFEIYEASLLDEYPIHNHDFTVWYFGANAEHADELGRLVWEGKKTGTASLHAIYAVEAEEVPKEGEYSVIVNWDGMPIAIIKTTSIKIVAFKDVTEEHAHAEGEGDLSLAFWREVHQRFFQQEADEFNLEFNEESKVVCERFKVEKKIQKP